MTPYDSWKTDYPFTPMPDASIDAEAELQRKLLKAIEAMNVGVPWRYRVRLCECLLEEEDRIGVRIEFMVRGAGELGEKLRELANRLAGKSADRSRSK